ncbi:hypothetical protein OHA72_53335 [Dactylosporangium sp. NBC_01737]|uniref:hypothetical protein n=1 Tax=Dactylosporangium sp. NBC_01737 TaxID=2975959 RepID=UPI002E13EFBC|nr:hypothetical protein OHA72_53335 [Dactylosporangium sp. NBC_01737]
MGASPAATDVDDLTLSGALDALDAAEQVWGPDLLAYLLGAGLDAPLAGWSADAAIQDPATRTRLRLVLEVQRLFDLGSVARAWVRDLHPALGFRSPASVIRTGDPDEHRMVLELAERDSLKPR